MASPEPGAVLSLPSLETVLAQWLSHPDLREVLRKRAEIGPLRGQLGWPMRLRCVRAERHFLGQHTLLLLSSMAAGGQYGLVLPNDQAAGLVARVLGGAGRPGVAGRAGTLSDAECGVLAYLSARCCAALGPELRLIDVRPTSYAELCALGEDAAVLPVAMAGSELQLDLALVLWAPLPSVEQALEVALSEPVETTTLRECEAGDVLWSDTWPLYATASGLSALAELRCAGIAAPLPVTLDAGHAQARSGELTSGNAQLLLTSCSASLGDLLVLGSGERWRVPGSVGERCVLSGPDGGRVEGALVRYRGAIGFRVSASYSTR